MVRRGAVQTGGRPSKVGLFAPRVVIIIIFPSMFILVEAFLVLTRVRGFFILYVIWALTPGIHDDGFLAFSFFCALKFLL